MGKLITIDGLDGSGKQTQGELLTSYLRGRGIKVREINFPMYERESSTLVRMYLEGRLGGKPSDTNSYAASMFFAADRYVSYVSDWRRDYEDADTVIITDRYTTANAIHQLSKLPEERWDEFLLWLYDFEFSRLELPVPDLVLYLEVTPEITLSLLDSRSRETGVRKDIHELDDSFIKKSYRAGLYAAEKLGWHKISCVCGDNTAEAGMRNRMRSREEISADIKAAVDTFLLK